MKMRNQQFIKYTNPSAFSVVIPVYNEAKRIEEGLKKILNFFNDNHFDYEIIIVDDGSTDQTVKIIKEFVARGFESCNIVKTRARVRQSKQVFLPLKKILFSSQI